MLVIIGTGLAGYTLAKEWRKLDKLTPLTLLTTSQGDFYSKPLLSTALAANKTAEDLSLTKASEMASQLNATVHCQTRVHEISIAQNTIKFDHQSLAYDRLVLACGASPIQIPIEGNAADEIFSVNDLEAYADYRVWLENNKKRLLILGSGLVGCEFANDLLSTGFATEIVSLDNYPLARLVPEPIGRLLQQAFVAKGAVWHLGDRVNTVVKAAAGYEAQLEVGGKIYADGVFSAIGLAANTALASEAGLKVRRGIVVDRQLRTSASNVYALGDCAEVEGELKQYVAPLLQCARSLAKILVGQDEQVTYPAMPVVIKTSLCPIVCCPVPEGVEGGWQYEGEGHHMKALFYDKLGQLRGFALTGDKSKEKFQLVKELPQVLG